MKKLKLADILATVLISFIFGLFYKVVGLMVAGLKPIGLHLDQIAYGLWFVAAIVAFLIIRKPGVALLHSFAQGLACELIFLIFKYKSYKLIVAMIAGATAGIFTIPVDWVFNYLGDLPTWNVILLYTIRIISGTILSGMFGYYIVKALEKTGVTNLFQSSSKKDIDSL